MAETGAGSIQQEQAVELDTGNRQWQVRLGSSRLLAECRPSPRPVVVDVVGAVRAAIANPIDFPPS